MGQSVRGRGFCGAVCNGHDDAAGFYRALKDCDPDVKYEVYVHLRSGEGFSSGAGRGEFPENVRWRGRRFRGVVIACEPDWGRLPVDLVFLDRAVKSAHMLLTILSPLERRGTRDEESKGILVDFRNDSNAILRLLPQNFPVHIYTKSADAFSPVSVENARLFETGLRKLGGELSRRQFGTARETFLYLKNSFPAEARRLAEELEFLFDPHMGLQRQRAHWERHRLELEWKIGLWSLLSRHSRTVPGTEGEEMSDEGMTDEREDLTEAVRGRDEPPASLEGASQARGESLEKAVLELFRRLFERDGAESEVVLERIRIQRSGTQNGFDVTFTCQDRFGVAVTCMVECKNYRNDLIRLDDVSPKLTALRDIGRRVDHWILISPNGQVSNELSQMAERWRNDFGWEPVRDVALGACFTAEREGLLVTGYKDGSVRSYSVKRGQEDGRWDFEVCAALPGGGESISGVAVDGAGGIYAGVSSGAIIRYKRNASGKLNMDRVCRLEVRCAGAKIDGVRPEEQYEILLRAGRES